MLNKIICLIIDRIKNNKQFLIDIFLQMSSSLLPIGVLQAFIYPSVAESLGGNNYGLLLTIYSVWILVSSSMVGSICSTRLINANSYEKKGLVGDYPIIARRWLLISIAVCLVLILYYNEIINPIHIVLQAVVAVLIFLSDYYLCFFKIKVDYNQIFINKVLISLGYIVGYFLYSNTGYWELIFICGYCFSVLHSVIVNGSDLLERIKTQLYSSTIRDCRLLLMPCVIDSLTNYADKLILYPLIGGIEVSIYYVATIIGKITSMFASSFRDVVLSYISRKTNDNKDFVKKTLIVCFAAVVIFYIVTIIISKPLIGILYPQWASEAIKYIYITTIASMLDIIINIIDPFTLKYCDTKWQISFSFGSAIIYFSSSLVLMRFFALQGFCIGNVIGRIARIILMCAVYFKNKT